ncbi:MAG: Slp family lipoprotein [Gammaproteobacteria bacterium]
MRLQRFGILIFSSALILALPACATSPFNKLGLEQVDRSITYARAVQNPDAVLARQVVFGGSIIATRNLADYTEVTVLAYPLDNTDRPNTSTSPLGRFLLVHPGYLEGVQYAPGRLLSARGVLAGVQVQALEQNTYTYPVLEARELHLWSSQDYAPRQSPLPSWLNIGIGIGL